MLASIFSILTAWHYWFLNISVKIILFPISFVFVTGMDKGQLIYMYTEQSDGWTDGRKEGRFTSDTGLSSFNSHY